MDPRCTTGAASRALGNTLPPSSHSIGLEAEAWVEKEYLRKGYQLLKRRWKTRLAEIDLLFQFPGSQPQKKLLIVEVKKRSSLAFRPYALPVRQKLRIQRVAQALAEKGYRVECHLVFVDGKGELEVFSDVFS